MRTGMTFSHFSYFKHSTTGYFKGKAQKASRGRECAVGDGLRRTVFMSHHRRTPARQVFCFCLPRSHSGQMLPTAGKNRWTVCLSAWMGWTRAYTHTSTVHQVTGAHGSSAGSCPLRLSQFMLCLPGLLRGRSEAGCWGESLTPSAPGPCAHPYGPKPGWRGPVRAESTDRRTSELTGRVSGCD